MPAFAPARAETTLVREKLAQIPEVEYVDLREIENGFWLGIVVAEKDAKVEKQVFSAVGEIIDALPNKSVDFRLFSRRGRSLSDVITPAENPVLKRIA